ncbi:hypothetical protein SUGI_0565030 [Cryptomeria japonica]|nr:hypothetical protein SUGI_0565030 [Cryptomeria japonica]
MNAAVAKKGVGLLFNATKNGLSSISNGLNKTKKAYASKHETDVLNEIKQRGVSPGDLIFQAFQRVYFLYMAGYKHELVAAAQMAGKRLADPLKSSVPLEAVMILGNSLCNECSQYGDFEKGNIYQNMQDFVTKSRMSKDHYDRESIVHDIYYAVLIAVEKYGTEEQTLEKTFKGAASRIIGSAMHVTDAKIDPRVKAAKAIYLFAAEISSCGREAELKKQKQLEDAEELLRKEKEKQRKFGRSASVI